MEAFCNFQYGFLEKAMNYTQDSARRLVARTRQQQQQRRASMLERSAQEINGMDQPPALS